MPTKSQPDRVTREEQNAEALERAFASLPSAHDSYRAGLRRGLDWDRPWKPGGPYVYTPDYMPRTDGWREYCRRSAENNQEWRRGWAEGVAIKAQLCKP